MTTSSEPTVDEVDAAIAAATPPLTDGDRRLVATLYRVLAAGRPGRVAELAAAASLPTEHVEDRLASWPGVFRDDAGAVVGFWGLALAGMPHRMRFADGADVMAWCAWDPLFIAPIVGRASVETSDPVSGAAVSYEVDDSGIVQPDPAHVVSFLAPADSWDEDVLGSFCHFVLHFTSRDTGERWTSEHPDTFLLPLTDAAELGRRHARRIAGATGRPGVPSGAGS